MDRVKAIVVKSTGSWYTVHLANGEVIKSRIKGKFRLAGKVLTNPIAVGDHVLVDIDEREGVGTIVEIIPRRNYVARQSPRNKREVHLLASNIDQAVIISTIVQPDIKLGFIDRYLLMIEAYDIPGVIVFNKSDLWGEEEMQWFEGLKMMYEGIGYQVMATSIVTGEGIQALADKLADITTLISGQSGVGKSSLVNAIEPGLALRTQDLSSASGKGQHTTTFAERHTLANGGYIIDTPGIKNLSFNHFDEADIAHNYVEFFKASAKCKFGSNCLHRSEPQCEVLRLIDEGLISPTRYDSYSAVLSEVEALNHWERNKKY